MAFARATLPVPAAQPPAHIPQSKLFRGTGLAAMNKTLLNASNNVQVLFKCSPSFGTVSHGYDANNSFNLNAFGERLFVHSGERDCYGSRFHRDWMWHTKSCNSVTAGGASQLRHSYACTGTTRPPKANLEKTTDGFRVTWPVAGAAPWTVEIPREG